jgi:hypothetical protein
MNYAKYRACAISGLRRSPSLYLASQLQNYRRIALETRNIIAQHNLRLVVHVVKIATSASSHV